MNWGAERERWVRPATLRYARPDGATVTIEHVLCGDCGFVSGIARVRFASGRGVDLTGAGCFERPRRGPEVARAWADAVAGEA